jgi:two-component system NarL family sensor kinase
MPVAVVLHSGRASGYARSRTGERSGEANSGRMTEGDTEPRGFRTVFQSEWTELGPLGRTVLIALAMSAVVALILAVAIPHQVEHHLLEGEIRSISRIASDMADIGLIPPDTDNAVTMAVLDESVRTNLLGSDTVRVKVWSPDGTVVYSDATELIGQSFPLSDDRIEAFNGQSRVEEPDLTLPENVYERTLPPAREFYIPVADESGSVVSVFEVYRLVEPIEATVGNIQRYIWFSIAIGIGLLTLFIVTLIMVNGRALTRRRRLTEELFSDLVRAQAEERTRIIGSLHDDIGQSLYRIHYGLEDTRSRVEVGDPISEDLARLGVLVGDVDSALRAELRLLQYGTGEELSLGSALDELVEVTEMETDLAVAVTVDTDCVLSPSSRVALFRAAREALTNVRKHALATTVEIRIRRTGKRVRLEVVDDGVGIIHDEGLGLTTTRERLESIGGGLTVKNGRNGGTRFAAWLPAGECDVES